MATQAHDDGFHEIQLNGKQLVFLFMAATVVSVVLFLCGVLVGRGVRTERNGASTESATIAPAGEPAAAAALPAAATTGSDPRTATPPPTVDDLSYFNRLDNSKQPADDLKVPDKRAEAAAAKQAEPAPTRAEKAAKAESDKADRNSKSVKNESAEKAPAKLEKTEKVEKVEKVEKIEKPAPAPAEAAPAAADAAAAEPRGNGFAVQIAALNVRSEADAIARRLASKGYSAYVLSPASGTPQVFRVRVGKFGSRREAEGVAAKLQKEEQFKPWITR